MPDYGKAAQILRSQGYSEDEINEAISMHQTKVQETPPWKAEDKADYAAMDSVQSKQPAIPSKLEIVGRGGLQGASLGYADEAEAGARALNIDPLVATGMLAAGPATAAAMPLYAGAKAIGALWDKGTAGVGKDYVDNRDTIQDANKVAKETNPWLYGGSQVAGGVATALLPFGAPATAAKAVEGGIAYGGLSALGESEADLTAGEFGDAAKDVTAGMAAGGVLGGAGYGVGKGLSSGARWLAATWDKDKMTGALTKFLNKTADSGVGGDVQGALDLAGKKIELATNAAGKTPVKTFHVQNMLAELEQKASNPLSGGLTIEEKEAMNVLEELVKRPQGQITLQELQNGLHLWGKRTKLYKNDPVRQGHAKEIYGALLKDVEEAEKNQALGPAAKVLQEGRAEYGVAMRRKELQETLKKSINPKSESKNLDLNKLVNKASGEKEANFARLIKDDPQVQQRFQDGIKVAQNLIYDNETSLPTAFSFQKVERMIKRLKTYKKLDKLFSDPKSVNEFKQLIQGDIKTAEDAVNIIARLSARAGDDQDETQDKLSSMFGFDR